VVYALVHVPLNGARRCVASQVTAALLAFEQFVAADTTMQPCAEVAHRALDQHHLGKFARGR
jgi:hypothetical protein